MPQENVIKQQGEAGQEGTITSSHVDAVDGTTFHLKVYSPFKTYYDDNVVSVSAINDTGPFDILARHKNFMTLISPCDIIIRNGKTEEKIPISRGIMHVKADKVVVFLDI